MIATQDIFGGDKERGGRRIESSIRQRQVTQYRTKRSCVPSGSFKNRPSASFSLLGVSRPIRSSSLGLASGRLSLSDNLLEVGTVPITDLYFLMKIGADLFLKRTQFVRYLRPAL